MKVYTVCARAQASIFRVFWPFSPKNIAKLLKKSERGTLIEQVVESKDLRRQPRSGWPFFHKLCDKYYRKSCKYMCNNSKKQKGKKISTSHYRSEFRSQRYGYKLPKKVGSTNILVRLLTVNLNNSLTPKIRKCATPFW